MHAYASADPLFVALNQRGQDEAQVGTFCASCHAPLAVRTGATRDGTNLASLPERLQGVTCYACHNVTQITNTHNNSTRLGNDSIMRGRAARTPMTNDAHQSAYSALHDRTQLESSKLCGSCHDVVNGHAVAIERSFAEWQASAFSGSNGSTCGQCHMPKSSEPGPIADVPGAPARARHSHQFPGVDLALTPFPEAEAQRTAVQSLLDTTLQTALCVRGTGTNANLVVVVDNVASGHKWPSGAAQDRRAWFEVAAFSQGRELVSQRLRGSGQRSGSRTGPRSVAGLGLHARRRGQLRLEDVGRQERRFQPDSRSADVRQVLAALLSNPRHALVPEGPAFEPAELSGARHARRAFAAFPLALFDELFADPAHLGLDADAVARLREQLLPLNVGEQLVWTPEAAADTAHGGHSYIDQGVPMSCVTTTGMNAAADKVPAPEHEAAACLRP